jgi:hypothetical protein
VADLLISVKPTDRGWAVQARGLEPAFFQSGSDAEAHARHLGGARSQGGDGAKVEVFDRDDRFVGAVSFPPRGGDGPPVPTVQDRRG